MNKYFLIIKSNIGKLTFLYYLFFFLILFFNFGELDRIFFSNHMEGDGLLSLNILRGFLNREFFVLNSLGWPFESNLLSFFGTHIPVMAIMYFLTIVSQNIFFALNITLLLSYLIVFLITFLCTKSFFKNNFSRIPFSLTFSLLPYHFYKATGHFEYAFYYTIPIFFFIIIKFFDNKFYNRKLFSLLFFIIGISGIYFAYYSFILFLVFILFLLINKKYNHLKYLIFYIFFLILGSLISIFPILYNTIINDYVGLIRYIFETEIYSQRFLTLLLPHEGHQINLLGKISNNLQSIYPVTEQKNHAFGIIGSIGVILCLINFFLYKKNKNDFLLCLSVFSVFTILFIMPGGIGILFNYIFSENFRAVSRFSIFINFVGLYFFFYHLEKIKKLLYIFSFLLPLIIYFDQVPKGYFGGYKLNKTIHFEREMFFSKIRSENFGDKTFIFPRIEFPEEVPSYKEGNYVRLLPHIYNSKLIVDYGGFKRNIPEEYYKQFKNNDFRTILNNLWNCNFDSILIVKKAINPKIYSSEVINEISPYKFSSSEFEFYELNKIIKKSREAEKCDKTYLAFKKGFYDLESNNQDSWRWSQEKSILDIYLDENKDYIFQFEIQSLTENEINIKNNIKKDISLNLDKGEIKKIQIPIKNENFLRLDFNAKNKIKISSDPRKLSFRILNATIIE